MTDGVFAVLQPGEQRVVFQRLVALLRYSTFSSPQTKLMCGTGVDEALGLGQHPLAHQERPELP